MATKADLLTARQFADDAGFVLTPIPRDTSEAMRVLWDGSQDPNWSVPVPALGTSYERLTHAQRAQVYELALSYAIGRVQVWIDSAIGVVSQVSGRELVDRLMANDRRMTVFPSRYPDGEISLSVSDFQRFADETEDGAPAFQYHVKGVSVIHPTGTLSASELVYERDAVLPRFGLTLRPASGTWPEDLDVDQYAYVNYWAGVPVTDPKWSQYRSAVWLAARNIKDGKPFELTIKRILNM